LLAAADKAKEGFRKTIKRQEDRIKELEARVKELEEGDKL
jgi:cell division septum initiation protein DivIVA